MNKKKQTDQKNKNDKKQAVKNANKKKQHDNAEEYLQGWKRALADYENLKKNLEKTKEENRNSIRIDFAMSLLPVIDNFEQAVNHVPDLSGCDEKTAKSIGTWLQGVIFIQKQFETVLNGMGISRIEVNGEIDPNKHEIVGEADEMKEVLSGWIMGDRVLRPAKIIIKKENKN